MIQFIYVQICSISHLLKVLLLTSEYGASDFHAYNSKEFVL